MAVRSVAALLTLCLTLQAGLVWARQATSTSIIFLPFEGPKGSKTSKDLSKRLQGIRFLNPLAYLQQAKLIGPARAAQQLGAAALVNGSIVRRQGRWLLQLKVIAVAQQKGLDKVFPLRSSLLSADELHQASTALATMLKQAGITASVRVARPQTNEANDSASTEGNAETSSEDEIPPRPMPWNDPPAEEATSATSGSDGGTTPASPPAMVAPSAELEHQQLLQRDEVARQRDAAQATPRSSSNPLQGPTTAGPVKSKPHLRDHLTEPFVLALLDMLVFGRRFTFHGAIPPYADFAGPSALFALGVEGFGYPLAHAPRRWLRGLGLEGRYFRSFGVRAEVQPGAGVFANAVIAGFDAGLRYRWPFSAQRLSPSLIGVTTVGRHVFAMARSGSTTVLVPDLGYTYLKLGLALDWPLLADGRWLIGAKAQLNLLPVFGAGPIEQNNPAGYGAAKTIAFDGALGAYAILRGFFLRFDFYYRQFRLSFDRTCGGLGTGCRVAKGATDVYLGAMLGAGYQY